MPKVGDVVRYCARLKREQPWYNAPGYQGPFKILRIEPDHAGVLRAWYESLDGRTYGVTLLSDFELAA